MPFFQSISSLFGGREQRSDTFKLPTTNLDHDRTLAPNDSPGPSRRSSYQPGQYPAGNGQTDRHPPISHTFHRLRNVLADSFPELIDALNAPAPVEQVAAFEQRLGCPLPPAVRDYFLEADGQDLESNARGIFYGLYLLPLDEVEREWEFWRQVENDPTTGGNPAILATMASVPPLWVKSVYACRGWIPLASDRSGNYIGVDVDPGTGGQWGQIIIFGRDFDRKCVLWRGEGEGGWGKWLASIVDEIESGDWEAEKTSDDEEEVGYTSYNREQSYGDAGKSMRLTGQYKGWSVLEAWWDRSVRRWEGLGLGMDVAEVERGMDEARRLTGIEKERGDRENKDKGKGKESVRSSIDIVHGNDVEIPVISSPDRNSPPHSAAEDRLLPPHSPEQSSIPRIQQPMETPTRLSPQVNVPMRLNTQLASTSSHPLSDDASTSSGDFLSPPARTSSRTKQRRARPPPPAPSQLDLPTRADVQAAQAVASAERSGLRGGWVMSLDASADAARRRTRTHGVSPSLDAEMVDIDLEAGRGEAFGSSLAGDELERQQEEDRLSLAGIEQRRGSRSPVLMNMSRTPSPLSRRGSEADQLAHGVHSHTSSASSTHSGRTPRMGSSAYVTPGGTPPPGSTAMGGSSIGIAAGAGIRPPPRAVESPRSHSPVPEHEREREVIRGGRSGTLQSAERGDSLMSTDSQDGLLGGGGGGDAKGLSASPPSIRVAELVDGMEEVAL